MTLDLAMARGLTWLCILACAIGCGEHADKIPSSDREITSPSDAACPTDTGYLSGYFECHTDEDCLAHYAPISTAGTLHYICFEWQCHSADYCVHTNAGAPDYCACGTDDCRYPDVCVEFNGVISCESRCGP